MAEKLLSRYPRQFGRDFEANKSFFDSLGLEISKKMRNRVVGYITQLRQLGEQFSQETVESTPSPPISQP